MASRIARIEKLDGVIAGTGLRILDCGFWIAYDGFLFFQCTIQNLNSKINITSLPWQYVMALSSVFIISASAINIKPGHLD